MPVDFLCEACFRMVLISFVSVSSRAVTDLFLVISNFLTLLPSGWDSPWSIPLHNLLRHWSIVLPCTTESHFEVATAPCRVPCCTSPRLRSESLRTSGLRFRILCAHVFAMPLLAWDRAGLHRAATCWFNLLDALDVGFGFSTAPRGVLSVMLCFYLLAFAFMYLFVLVCILFLHLCVCIFGVYLVACVCDVICLMHLFVSACVFAFTCAFVCMYFVVFDCAYMFAFLSIYLNHVFDLEFGFACLLCN